MAEFYNAETLLEFVKQNTPNIDGETTMQCVERAIKNAPTAEVVEVVRCEKCKHGDVSTISKSKDGQEDVACYCTLKKVVTDVDYYCPSGERKQKNDFKE